jgi:methylated-DNA-[protein]-cysteine S-methyltransferase
MSHHELDSARQPEIAVFETRLGWVAVVLTGRGIAASTLFLSDCEQAIAQLRPDWPQAAILDQDQFPDLREALCRYAQGEKVSFEDQKFDLSHCSAFQRRVLRAVLKIPHGQTRSYANIARSLDRPGAARAVGQALARNPLPLLVPCHRVLSEGGQLRGFSAPGGIETKRQLLELERAWQS